MGKKLSRRSFLKWLGAITGGVAAGIPLAKTQPEDQEADEKEKAASSQTRHPDTPYFLSERIHVKRKSTEWTCLNCRKVNLYTEVFAKCAYCDDSKCGPIHPAWLGD